MYLLTPIYGAGTSPSTAASTVLVWWVVLVTGTKQTNNVVLQISVVTSHNH